MLCPMKRGNGGGDFYDRLQMVLEQMQCRDVQIVMADMNAKVMMDNTGREEVMGKHGVRPKMNDNGLLSGK